MLFKPPKIKLERRDLPIIHLHSRNRNQNLGLVFLSLRFVKFKENFACLGFCNFYHNNIHYDDITNKYT